MSVSNRGVWNLKLPHKNLDFITGTISRLDGESNLK